MLAPQWRMFQHIHSQSAAIWAHMAAGTCTPGPGCSECDTCCRSHGCLPTRAFCHAYETVKIPAQVCDLRAAEHDNSNCRPFLVEVSGLLCIPALLNKNSPTFKIKNKFKVKSNYHRNKQKIMLRLKAYRKINLTLCAKRTYQYSLREPNDKLKENFWKKIKPAILK